MADGDLGRDRQGAGTRSLLQTGSAVLVDPRRGHDELSHAERFSRPARRVVESDVGDTVAALVHQGLVPLETITQDGMRVRASAGAGSFRRKPTLEELQNEAQAHVDRLKDELQNEMDERKKSAKERAAHDRKARIDEAFDQYDELRKKREKRKKEDGQRWLQPGL